MGTRSRIRGKCGRCGTLVRIERLGRRVDVGANTVRILVPFNRHAIPLTRARLEVPVWTKKLRRAFAILANGFTRD